MHAIRRLFTSPQEKNPSLVALCNIKTFGYEDNNVKITFLSGSLGQYDCSKFME